MSDAVASTPPRRLSGRFLRQIIGLIITALVLWWFARRISDQWDQIRPKIISTELARIAAASVMFAIFLFVFRALVWWRLLIGFGHKLPIAPATRIWCTSELARYVPGSVLQFFGRAYLCRPYGVDGRVCSTSQILELTIFLLANIVMGLICLPWFGSRLSPHALRYLYGAAALAPLLLLILHPRIFYGMMDRILAKLGKPPIEPRLKKRLLFKLMLWTMLGLVWQGAALYVLISQPDTLGLKLSQLPLVIGAYSIAWAAGFLAITNSAGIGVREAVLVTVLRFSLPPDIVAHFNGDERALKAFLMFLGVLLRFWTIIGELLLAGIIYVADYRGAVGNENAPGRVNTSTPPVSHLSGASDS